MSEQVKNVILGENTLIILCYQVEEANKEPEVRAYLIPTKEYNKLYYQASQHETATGAMDDFRFQIEQAGYSPVQAKVFANTKSDLDMDRSIGC